MKSFELKEIRLMLGYTQERMAKALGIARITYVRYEKGDRIIPDGDTVAQLARKLVDT